MIYYLTNFHCLLMQAKSDSSRNPMTVNVSRKAYIYILSFKPRNNV